MLKLSFLLFVVIVLVGCQKEISDFSPVDNTSCKTTKIYSEVISNEMGQIDTYRDTLQFFYQNNMLERIHSSGGDIVLQYQDSLVVKLTAYSDYQNPITEWGYYSISYQPGNLIASIDTRIRSASGYDPYSTFQYFFNTGDSVPSRSFSVWEYDLNGNPVEGTVDSLYYTFSNSNLVKYIQKNLDPINGFEETHEFTYNSKPNMAFSACPELLWTFILYDFHLINDRLSAILFSKNELAHWKNNLEDIDVNYTYNTQSGRLTSLTMAGSFDLNFVTGSIKFTIDSSCQ